VFLAREPPRFHEREQRGDVVEMVVGEQDGRDALVAGVGAGESPENAAAAVDEQRPIAVVEEVSRLDAVGNRHRAPAAEHGESHTPRYVAAVK